MAWTAAALAALAAALWLALAWLGLAAHDSRDAFVESRVPPDLAERFYPPASWAWGLVQLGDGPSLRYGVAAPDVAPRAQVLILPDYGESAETWFETVRDLSRAGLTVWVLEGVGEGGSARLTGRRDLGHVESFDVDVATAKEMVSNIIRPSPDAPLLILGQGHGALIAARMAETRAKPAALILSAPACPTSTSEGRLLRGLGLGVLRAPGAAAWRRDGPDEGAQGRTHDRWRGQVTHRWQIANPDLRLGGPSLDWLAAEARLAQDVQADESRIAAPTLVLRPASGPACPSPPGARSVLIPGAGPALELEDDARRQPWLAAVLGAVDRIQPAPTTPLRSRSVTHLFKPERRL